jgi:tetraprenyl-beta-curcumene synthase
MEGRSDAPGGLTRPAGGGPGERLALAATFVRAAVSYWLTVFPRASWELRRWRRRAARISDSALRRAALEALEKRGNIEGAAAFAALVRGRRRRTVVRALVAYQAAYNYVDLLAEQPSVDPVANAQRLHEALLVALDPLAAHPDYYAMRPGCDDGGYLAEIVDACRAALNELPSRAAVAIPASRAAARIVAFQSFSQAPCEQLEGWASTLAPADSGLAWWEAAAAAGSSLGVHVLIAAASEPRVSAERAGAIERAYFPWIGALHSLLDSLVDRAEDAATAQLSLVGFYRSPQEAATRMRWLTVRALEAARALPDPRRHQVLAAAMACHYLSAPELASGWGVESAQGVREALGGLATPALAIFRARRFAGGLGGTLAAARRSGRDAAQHDLTSREPRAACLGDGERSVDAGAA